MTGPDVTLSNESAIVTLQHLFLSIIFASLRGLVEESVPDTLAWSGVTLTFCKFIGGSLSEPIVS
jgi:hypothetical protein